MCSSDLISHSVIIELYVQFPNVFTPNGDGVNDKFEIVGLKPGKENKLEVFNRWGKKIYESTNYKNDWDGENYADGVYYFIFTLPQGIAEPTHGTVTIMR